MLELEHVTVARGHHRFAWHFAIPENAFVAITGPSGCGKSSMLRCLQGLIEPVSGSIRWQGENLMGLTPAQRPFGLLFQRDNLFEHLSVRQNLALGLSASGKLTEAEQEALMDAANRFQIGPLLERKASALSGGQQQRVALARLFLQDRPVLLLDEPFSSLDPDLRLEGLAWVRELQAIRGSTVLMVTHHFDEVSQVADFRLHPEADDDWRLKATEST